MKSTSISEVLPQWTKFVVVDPSGRDPLGLARVAANITDHLLPGIVVATDRARYYALYSWILWNICETESPDSYEAFAEAFQRRESAFSIATVLHGGPRSPVGKRAVDTELAKTDGDVRTAFQVLPSSKLGGYGQYYSGSLYNLGLTHRPDGGFDQVTAGRGVRLAEAIERTIRSTRWATGSGFKKRRLPLETLKASAGRLTLDAVREPFAEHERVALTEIFFGLDAEEAKVSSWRRQSLARILCLTQAYAKSSIPLGGADDATVDDQLVLGPAYFRMLVGSDGRAAAPHEPPAFLTACSDLWQQFCLHEILSWALESVLSALLSLLGEAPGNGLTMDDVVARLAGEDLGRAVERYSDIEAVTPRTLLAGLGVADVPSSQSCQRARAKFSLEARLNEDALMRTEAATPVELLGRALACLGLLYAKWRDGSDDAAWLAIRARVGQELAATTVLPRLDAWLDVKLDWATAVRSLLELVLAHHDRIMYEKGRLEACWVGREEDRLVHDQDYVVGYPAHASRQRSAMGILLDLGLVSDAADGRHAPTKAGAAIYSRVEALGR